MGLFDWFYGPKPVSAWTKQDLDREMFKTDQRLAAEGNASAQLNLAIMYSNGDVVPQNDNQALEWAMKSAVQGHPGAQYFLGRAYETGTGCSQDCKQAVQWYIEAAKQVADDSKKHEQLDIAQAKNNLAFIYANGHGLPEHSKQVVAWLTDMDNVPALLCLGKIFAKGLTVEKDQAIASKYYLKLIEREMENAKQLSAAAGQKVVVEYVDNQKQPLDFNQVIEWLKETAERGVAEAQFAMGEIYEHGWRDVPADHKQAVFWYQKASEQGFARAPATLSESRARVLASSEDEDRVPPTPPTPASPHSSNDFEEGVKSYYNKDYATAARFFLRAAERGHAWAQYSMGLMCDKGQGVAQDYDEAASWYQKSAKQGLPEAQYNLGVMYIEGQGVPTDYRQAVFWFQKAAEQGHAEAQFNLGNKYAQGLGVERDDEQAISWLQKAAEQGIVQAQFTLGLKYFEGQGVAQDYRHAVSWYQKAAEQGFAAAQYNLGAMYRNGHGVAQDYGEADKWFSLAAANGNEMARKVLELLREKSRGQ